MSFFNQIDLNTLTEVDRAIYQYLHSHSAQIPYMRVREVANESHTSASSVMRFIRKMGYESFTDFKLDFKVPTIPTGEYHYGPELLSIKNFPSNLFDKLEELADLIVPAENIIFCGIGASGNICEYASRRLASIGFNTFPLTDFTYPVASKLRNTADNVMIFLSVSGQTNEVIEIANTFKEFDDCATVAVTSQSSSTLALMTDYLLDYKISIQKFNKHEDYTSQLQVLYLMELLIDTIKTKSES